VDDYDWQLVRKSIHMASILPCGNWNSKLESIMDDTAVDETLIDPEAIDATAKKEVAYESRGRRRLVYRGSIVRLRIR
jgi:hypothetical protein